MKQHTLIWNIPFVNSTMIINENLKMKKTILLLIAAITLNACAFAQKVKPENPNIITMTTPDDVKTYTMSKELQTKMKPGDALKKLKDGNERFINGKMKKRNLNTQLKITAAGQYPFATVVSCIDSRVSSELIFDQGFGDVFNARIAGNFVNTDIIGSLEFACVVSGSKVIVVLGHSNCGAIKGACDHVELGNLTATLNNIKPAVDNVKCCGENRTSKNHDFVDAVAKENVLQSIKEIREKSPLLKGLEDKGDLKIVGAMFNLETGKVEWYN